MINLQLERKIFQACRAAIENGYVDYIMFEDVLIVARDMMTADADVEELCNNFIVPVIDGICAFRIWAKEHEGEFA